MERCSYVEIEADKIEFRVSDIHMHVTVDEERQPSIARAKEIITRTSRTYMDVCQRQCHQMYTARREMVHAFTYVIVLLR